MGSAENKSKPILKRLILGLPTSLTVDQQADLAHWAMIKFCMFDGDQKRLHLRYGSGVTSRSTRDQIKSFSKTRQLPSNLMVSIGSSQKLTGGIHCASTESEIADCWQWAFLYQIGFLNIIVLGFTNNSMGRLHPAGLGRRDSITIWPAQKERLWNNNYPQTEKQLDRIAKQISPSNSFYRRGC